MKTYEIFIFVPFHGQLRLSALVDPYAKTVKYSQSFSDFDILFNCRFSDGNRFGTCLDFVEGEDYSKYDDALLQIDKEGKIHSFFTTTMNGSYFLNYNKNKEFDLTAHVVSY